MKQTCTVKRVVGELGGPRDFYLHAPSGELVLHFGAPGEGDPECDAVEGEQVELTLTKFVAPVEPKAEKPKAEKGK